MGTNYQQEKMRILSNGNVGIGETAPTARLQVKASGTSNPNINGLYVYNPTSGSGDAIITARVNGQGGDPYVSFDTYGYAGWAFGMDSSDSGKLKWGHSWSSLTTSTFMTLDNSGNLGIGTTSPGHKLDIKANPFGHIGLMGSSSGRYSISTTSLGDSLMFTHGSYSWGKWANAHHYDVYSGRSGDNLTGARDFYLNYYSGAPVRLVNGTSVSSDDRIKTNERYITNATETLLKLKPQIYDKGPSLGGGTGETRVESGLIVQDIYYDAPELRHLVHYDEDAEIPDEKPYVDDDPQKDPDYSMWGTKSAGLNYEGFIAYLIKSNQEIYTQLQAEKARNDSLEARILALENA
jgi:hypothetical protein